MVESRGVFVTKKFLKLITLASLAIMIPIVIYSVYTKKVATRGLRSEDLSNIPDNKLPEAMKVVNKIKQFCGNFPVSLPPGYKLHHAKATVNTLYSVLDGNRNEHVFENMNDCIKYFRTLLITENKSGDMIFDDLFQIACRVDEDYAKDEERVKGDENISIPNVVASCKGRLETLLSNLCREFKRIDAERLFQTSFRATLHDSTLQMYAQHFTSNEAELKKQQGEVFGSGVNAFNKNYRGHPGNNFDDREIVATKFCFYVKNKYRESTSWIEASRYLSEDGMQKYFWDVINYYVY